MAPTLGQKHTSLDVAIHNLLMFTIYTCVYDFQASNQDPKRKSVHTKTNIKELLIWKAIYRASDPSSETIRDHPKL